VFCEIAGLPFGIGGAGLAKLFEETLTGVFVGSLILFY
jgi:hypothetical protein